LEKNTLIYQLNHFEIHSDKCMLSSQTSFYAILLKKNSTRPSLHKLQ